MEASQKPDEASAQLQVPQGELGLFSDPHAIRDKEVGLRLVASLPGGKTGQLGPYRAAKIALAKSIAATDPDDFNLEGLEDEFNSIHKVLYPHMWNDEKENTSTSDEQAMMAAGNGAPPKKTKCPNCDKWHRGQCRERTTSMATQTPTLTNQMTTACAHIVQWQVRASGKQMLEEKERIA